MAAWIGGESIVFVSLYGHSSFRDIESLPNFKVEKQRFRPLKLNMWIFYSALIQTQRVLVTYQTRHKSEYIPVSSVHQSNSCPLADASAPGLYRLLRCGKSRPACSRLIPSALVADEGK